MSYIGIFDSGVGGLTILNALRQYFPSQSFVYVADSKNFPYGNKDESVLKSILQKNLSLFKDADAIIVACSTLSLLLPSIIINKPIISMVDALMASFAQESHHIHTVGILATLFTVNQNVYPQKFGKNYPKISVYQSAAPHLASAIETNSQTIDSLIKQYLAKFPNHLDAIVLACTHYNVVFDKIKEWCPNITIVNPYSGIKELIQPYIRKTKNPSIRLLTNHYSDKIALVSKAICGQMTEWTHTYE